MFVFQLSLLLLAAAVLLPAVFAPVLLAAAILLLAVWSFPLSLSLVVPLFGVLWAGVRRYVATVKGKEKGRGAPPKADEDGGKEGAFAGGSSSDPLAAQLSVCAGVAEANGPVALPRPPRQFEPVARRIELRSNPVPSVAAAGATGASTVLSTAVQAIGLKVRAVPVLLGIPRPALEVQPGLVFNWGSSTREKLRFARLQREDVKRFLLVGPGLAMMGQALSASSFPPVPSSWSPKDCLVTVLSCATRGKCAMSKRPSPWSRDSFNVQGRCGGSDRA